MREGATLTLQAWLAHRSETTRRLASALAILALAVVIGSGVSGGVQSNKAPTGPGKDDVSFYVRVIARVKQGQPYYPVVADEVRALHGSLKPFLTVRTPWLATGLAALPGPAWGVWIMRAFAAAALAAWAWRLRILKLEPLPMTFAAVMLASGYGGVLMGQAYVMHEAWAGLLIALALALHRPGRWWPSLVLALLAALERELAAPFLLVMAGFALAERRPREMAAWLAAFAVFALALWRHARHVEALYLPSDTASPGWLGGNGWPFVLHAATWNALTLAWPASVVVLLPLALLGLAAAEDTAVKRAAVTVFGFCAALLLVGRPENYYWGMMIAPLWALGLIAAPRVLRRLARDLGGSPPPTGRSTVTGLAANR
ncbi:MAG TPA: hypothetical protein VMU59_09090 [Caulobacteraceae bacterium]|nr:hypothetical protein [Caulobacteraceae bacterium]